MLLMRIAPCCDRYIAADFSSVVLSRLIEQLQKIPGVEERVEVMERRADNFDGLDENSVDTVVINSVAQFFPNTAYLTRVLEGALSIVKPGGHVYVGDVRSLPLLSAFACSVELFQAADEASSEELRDRIRRRVERDQELVLSPAYFLSFRHRFSKVSRVDIRLLRGRADNEMSRYRYEAILHVGHESEALSKDEFLDWTEHKWTLDHVRSLLRQHPKKRLGIKRIQNARVEKDIAALAILGEAGATHAAGQLRRSIEQNVVAGIHPQDLMDMEKEDLDFAVCLSWAACRSDGSYDVCFVPAESPQEMTCPAIGWPEPDASEFVRFSNAPGQRKLRSEVNRSTRGALQPKPAARNGSSRYHAGGHATEYPPRFGFLADSKVGFRPASVSMLFDRSCRSILAAERLGDEPVWGSYNPARVLSSPRGLRPSYFRRTMKGHDPCCSMVCKGPSHRCNRVCAQNLAQMSFNFLKLDPVAEYLDLIVDSAEMVKCSGEVFVSKVPGAIPTASLQCGKASRG